MTEKVGGSATLGFEVVTSDMDWTMFLPRIKKSWNCSASLNWFGIPLMKATLATAITEGELASSNPESWVPQKPQRCGLWLLRFSTLAHASHVTGPKAFHGMAWSSFATILSGRNKLSPLAWERKRNCSVRTENENRACPHPALPLSVSETTNSTNSLNAHC